jgi:hypothetical protein
MTSSQASIGNDDVDLATRMGTRMAARTAGDRLYLLPKLQNHL